MNFKKSTKKAEVRVLNMSAMMNVEVTVFDSGLELACFIFVLDPVD